MGERAVRRASRGGDRSGRCRRGSPARKRTSLGSAREPSAPREARELRAAGLPRSGRAAPGDRRPRARRVRRCGRRPRTRPRSSSRASRRVWPPGAARSCSCPRPIRCPSTAIALQRAFGDGWSCSSEATGASGTGRGSDRARRAGVVVGDAPGGLRAGPEPRSRRGEPGVAPGAPRGPRPVLPRPRGGARAGATGRCRGDPQRALPLGSRWRRLVSDVEPPDRRWPPVEIVRPGPEGRAPRLVQALRTTRRGFVFSPLPGYGVARVCRSCGRPAACAVCRGVLRQMAGRIACVVCGADGACAVCGATIVRGRTGRGGAGRGVGRASGARSRASDRPAGAPRRAPRSSSVGRTTFATSGPATSSSWRSSTPTGPPAARGSPPASERSPSGWRRSHGLAPTGARSSRRRTRPTTAVQALVRGQTDRFHEQERRRRADAGFPVGTPVFRVVGDERLDGGARGVRPRVVARSPRGAGAQTVCLVAVALDRVPAFGPRRAGSRGRGRRRTRRSRPPSLTSDRRRTHRCFCRSAPSAIPCSASRRSRSSVRSRAAPSRRRHARNDVRRPRRRSGRATGRRLAPGLRLRRRRDGTAVHGEPRARPTPTARSSRRKAACRSPGRSTPRRGSAASVCRGLDVRGRPSSSSATACSLGSSNTRPTISTGCCTSIGLTRRDAGRCWPSSAGSSWAAEAAAARGRD